MATVTLGTAATTTLTAVKWTPAAALADIAAINALFKHSAFTDPTIQQSQTYKPNAYINNGMLIVPERNASIRLYNGDYIAADPNTGHFILISGATAAAASWVHT
jgi:hypothetical protein